MLAATRRRDRDGSGLDEGERRRGCRRLARASSGGHPICGSESRGAENASAGLFDGATWFLTPAARHRPGAPPARCTGFVVELGATPVAIDAGAHDRLVALTSHVPHVLANVVANQTGATRDRRATSRLRTPAARLRDMTRIAGANPRIWVDIFLDNADASARGARRAAAPDRAGRGALCERRDAGFLARWIGEAARTGAGCSSASIPDPGGLQRLRVHVPDRPGVLAGITQALGAERINIEDFELDHVSPERGGTLTLLVAGEGEAQRAAELLESQGYSVVVSAVLDESGDE